MPQLSTMMKQTKRFGPSAVKMAKKAGPKATAATLSKAAKARSAAKDAASKVSHFASDYGHKAADTAKSVLPDKKKHVKKMASDSKPKKSSPMFGVSLTKAFLMIAGSAIAALLFAPKPGKELRTDLKHRASDVKDKGMDEAKGMMHDAKDTYSEMKDKRKAHSDTSGTPVAPTYTSESTGATFSSIDSIPAEAAPLATDEYVSESSYDEAVDLSVPLDTDPPLADEDKGTSL